MWALGQAASALWAGGTAIAAGATIAEAGSAAFGATILGKGAAFGSAVAAGDLGAAVTNGLDVVGQLPGAGQVGTVAGMASTGINMVNAIGAPMTAASGAGGTAGATGTKGSERSAQGSLPDAASKNTQPSSHSAGQPATNSLKTNSDNVIHVTKDGVALPAGPKYEIPSEYVQHPARNATYGVVGENGKFSEKLRIDPATPPGRKGPNYSHYHLDKGRDHFSPSFGNKDPGFRWLKK